MCHAAGMRVLERIGDLRSKTHDILSGEAAGRDAVGERLPFHELHDDEGLGVVGADFVDGADVGVIQARGVLRFALQPGVRIVVAGDAHLDCDGASELEVFRGIDLTHAADAKETADPVTADRPARQRWTCVHCGRRIRRGRRPVDERRGLFVRAEQPVDLGAKRGVIAARRRQKGRAAGRDVFNRRVKDLFHAHPALGRHEIALKTAISSLVPKDMPIPI